MGWWRPQDGYSRLKHRLASTNRKSAFQAADLVAMFKLSWQVIADALVRCNSADLEQIFPAPASHQAWLQSQGLEPEPPHTRRWIVWHVLEHEIHHGGELSLALG